MSVEPTPEQVEAGMLASVGFSYGWVGLVPRSDSLPPQVAAYHRGRAAAVLRAAAAVSPPTEPRIEALHDAFTRGIAAGMKQAERVSPPTEPPEKHEANRWGLLVEHCDGPVCVECCLCEKCGRKVGTRHLDVCACPTDKPLPHWYCDDCSPPTEPDAGGEPVAWVMGAVLCACGHRLASHDPADGECEAGAFPPCECRYPRSPNPDMTLDELRLAAVAPLLARAAIVRAENAEALRDTAVRMLRALVDAREATKDDPGVDEWIALNQAQENAREYLAALAEDA